MGKVASPNRVPKQGQPNQVSRGIPRSKRAGYAERYKQREHQRHPARPAIKAHKGPSKREGGCGDKDWSRLMTEGIRFGR